MCPGYHWIVIGLDPYHVTLCGSTAAGDTALRAAWKLGSGRQYFRPMGKKRKLKKKLRKRGLEEARCLVICVGKSCNPNVDAARELLRESRAYAEANCPSVRVEAIGCLHVCKKGPVAATYPSIKFKKHVDLERARRLIDKLEREP